LLLACACLTVASGCNGRPERAYAAARVDSLQLGTAVPDVPFTLQDGFELRLPAMKGKTIAVLFCTTHDDPQCVREADAMRDHFSELHDEHHVVIIGVSPASNAAHKAHLTAHRMPFDFASDPDGRVAAAFGAGGMHEGLRVVVVDRGGTIHAVWSGADPERHVRELLAAASG
jgi:peroxiredoxin